MSQLQDQLENIPGYGVAMDYFNEYAEEHWNAKADPYEDKDGNKVRLPKELATKREQKAWKKIQSQAWVDDKCFLGSCGVGMDCGLGLAPLVILLFPVLGPIIMYAVHARLISIAQQNFNLPNKLISQMQANIMFDLLITFPPVIGSFFGWLHSCSTRNAGMVYVYLEKMLKERASERGVRYAGTGVTAGTNSLTFFGTSQQRGINMLEPVRNEPTRNPFKKQRDSIEVGQQQSGFM